jgi:hypothetical protein
MNDEPLEPLDLASINQVRLEGMSNRDGNPSPAARIGTIAKRHLELTWNEKARGIRLTAYEPAESASCRRRRRSAGSVRDDAEICRIPASLHQQHRQVRSSAARRDRSLPPDRSSNGRQRDLLDAPRVGNSGRSDRSLHPPSTRTSAIRRRAARDQRAAATDLCASTVDAERSASVLIAPDGTRRKNMTRLLEKQTPLSSTSVCTASDARSRA